MRELYEGLDSRVLRNELLTALRPALSTPIARSCGSYHCSPEDHKQIESKRRPSDIRKHDTSTK